MTTPGFPPPPAPTKARQREHRPRTSSSRSGQRANAGNAGMSEADFQRRVIETARLYGWRVCHYQDSTLKSGRFGTAVQGDAGGQDLILARDGVVILAELKSDRGRLRPEQKLWEDAAGGHARVWRPRDWDAVLAELSAGCSRVLSVAEQAGCSCPMCPKPV